MCSLLGLVSKNAPLQSDMEGVFENMLKVSHHRGPDDTCIRKLDDRVIFGSNRLAIVDVSTCGRIPMPDEDERYWVIYNGEIYNYAPLRKELEDLGYTFKSGSDTEVVVNGYKAWGKKCLQRFNGEFAFAIWDTKEGVLFIARDRFGIKPLYYMETDTHIIVSSDFRAFLHFPGFTKVIDPQSLTSYLYLRYVPGQKSILQGVCKVLPAEYIQWNIQEHTKIHDIFWQPHFAPLRDSEQRIATTLQKKLKDAVEHSLTGDVDVGVLLSGGIDSSMIVGMMDKLGKKPIKTFSCTYKEPGTLGEKIEKRYPFSLVDTVEDESYYSDLVSKTFHTQHTTLHIQEEDVDQLFRQMIYEFGEPMASTDALGHFLLGRALKKHVKVALTGLGGDELFGGYIELFFKEKGKLLTSDVDTTDYIRLYSTIGGTLDVGKYLSATYKDTTYFRTYIERVVAQFPREKYPEEKVNEFMYFLLFVDMVGWELEQADRIYMASSIETRPVFLDNELTEYAMCIPSIMKFNNGNEKYILKEALQDILPKEIIERKKFPGLGTPRKFYDKPWFQKRLERLKHSSLDIWDKDELHKLITGAIGEAEFELLYRMIVLEEWYSIFILNEPV